MEASIETILENCIVKLKIPGKTGWGTGFLVSPSLVLTCCHVVKEVGDGSVEVCFSRQNKIELAVVQEAFPDPFDIALLKFNTEIESPYCVYLDIDVKPGDSLYTFGYPDDFHNGAPVTFECEGITGDIPMLIKFKQGQTRPGLSGSPLLNRRTGKVCGLVKFTRDRSTDLGGGGISVKTVFSMFQSLNEVQKDFHNKSKIWTNLIKGSNKFIELKSARKIDYSTLKNLLTLEKWEEANVETTRIFDEIIKFKEEVSDVVEVRAIESNSIDIRSVINFPCADLRTIDQLWTNYSEGHFGFSVQKRIWESIRSNKEPTWNIYCDFAKQVGWFDACLPEEMNNIFSFPEGYLPTAIFSLYDGSNPLFAIHDGLRKLLRDGSLSMEPKRIVEFWKVMGSSAFAFFKDKSMREGKLNDSPQFSEKLQAILYDKSFNIAGKRIWDESAKKRIVNFIQRLTSCGL